MPDSLRNVMLIARREYLEKIRGRAFRFSTVLVPALIILVMLSSYMTNRNIGKGQRIVIAAAQPALAAAVRDDLLTDREENFKVDVVAPATERDRAALAQQLQAKSINGYLWIETAAGGSPSATYVSGSAMGSESTGRLKRALNQALVEQRLVAGGMKQEQIDALFKSAPVESLRMDASGKAGKGDIMSSMTKIMIEMFLLTMPILLYGMDMARSIIEEKSSRIFEVMLSAASPGDLLAGKLIGIGGVGLTQIAIWIAAAILLSGTAIAGAVMRGNFAFRFTLIEGILFPIYFLLGYLLYSALFAGLAANCETVQEFQMYAPLAALPCWFSFGLMPVLMNNPGSRWSVIASLFPATSPFVAVPRIGMAPEPWWQTATSVVLLVLSVWAVLWFASRLYRVGILMYGKRATLPEIVRWLRYS